MSIYIKGSIGCVIVTDYVEASYKVYNKVYTQLGGGCYQGYVHPFEDDRGSGSEFYLLGPRIGPAMVGTGSYLEKTKRISQATNRKIQEQDIALYAQLRLLSGRLIWGTFTRDAILNKYTIDVIDGLRVLGLDEAADYVKLWQPILEPYFY